MNREDKIKTQIAKLDDRIEEIRNSVSRKGSKLANAINNHDAFSYAVRYGAAEYIEEIKQLDYYCKLRAELLIIID